MKIEITEETANWIWDVLVARCGVSPNDQLGRDSFVFCATDCEWREWRFGGDLGFGGKVWSNAGRFYVSCYMEDETPKRKKILEETNQELAEISEEVYGAKG